MKAHAFDTYFLLDCTISIRPAHIHFGWLLALAAIEKFCFPRLLFFLHPLYLSSHLLTIRSVFLSLRASMFWILQHFFFVYYLLCAILTTDRYVCMKIYVFTKL